MSRAGWRGGLIGLGTVLAAPMLMALGPAPTFAAPAGHIVAGHIVPGHIVSGQITAGHTTGGHTTGGHIAAAPLTSASPPKSERIKILSAALNRMTRNYKKDKFFEFAVGPPDILDYQVGDLWRKGIDGTGTTVAVIEGWNDPSIRKFIAGADKILHLPNPRITTIYPTGKHRLPDKCPPGMVKLGDYGSCNGWKGERSSTCCPCT